MLRIWSILLFLLWIVTIAPTMPLQKGMELRYEGEMKETFTFANIPGFSFTRRVVLLVEVMKITSAKEAEVAQLHFTEFEGEEGVTRSSRVGFGKVAMDGRVFGSWERPLTFPYLFIAPKQLREGRTWSSKEVLIAGFFSIPLKGRVVYRVLWETKMDCAECWLILRHLVQPVTLHAEDGRNFVVPAWTDWIWVDAQSGLVRRLKRRWQYYAPYSTVKRIQTSVVDITLRQINNLSQEAQKRLLTELERIHSVMEAVELNYERIRQSEEKLSQAEQMVIDTISALRESPYADFYLPYLERWLESIRYWQKGFEAPKLVGNLAPDFELPVIDKTAKVKLSDLRGKVILLNFFSHG
ncbi:MAG: peroxiredoxin family protein [Armatimonadetes bacterium]|nr:peroxiredoxin family protein [Armatimonadota bacterium]MDW8028620.1 hypothetical protein [Armatimonadota bacterium]